ncbi:LOW QUALITY PROTEIN: histamine receptor H2b [Gadus macrocephalus]|uniref:LOW QUALITY PROTEIN: histamine receptor H2b n=1 Tax=Gadus macrocephalus TaxID=80720 RepID=UPI0028CBA135|nr:LOW QUALITY PROTEIN: histamine receptor H2b [Gadus macrocephalus]
MISSVLRWLVLVSFIGLTVGGNLLVCLAVLLSRRLRRRANCFVISLAVTDLLLGLLVMPLSASLELRAGGWPLGGALCNLYISVDVMLCTASILTLLAVSVDRYLAISLPLGYHRRVTPCRVALALAAIWTTSLTVSFLPIHLGWNTVDYSVQHADWGVGVAQQGGRYCHYEWNNKYVLLNAFGTFYLPLVLMCGMYLLIFRVAREQVRRIRAATPSFSSAASVAASLREHKATVTLAAVLGAFVVCWFPYFTFFTCMGLRADMTPPTALHSVVLWLGYFNSVLNPILYPALNRDFRRAYSQLLRCRPDGRRCRGGPDGRCRTGCCCGWTWWRRPSKPRPPAAHHRRVSLGNGHAAATAAATAAADDRTGVETGVAVVKETAPAGNGGLAPQEAPPPKIRTRGSAPWGGQG